ncbi:MAG: hypothetical protein WC294_00070 [Methanoregula sp.]
MLGMTIPHKFPALIRRNKTLRISMCNPISATEGPFFWEPDFDYSPFAQIDISPLFVPVDTGAIDVNAQYAETTYYDTATSQYVNTPWLVRGTAKSGEASIDISSKNMTSYIGDDIGSTPFRVEVVDGGSLVAAGFIGAPGDSVVTSEMLSGWTELAEGYGTEKLTGWTEQVQGDYDFSTFNVSGSTITTMEVDGISKSQGLAFTNTFAMVEGHTYQFAISITNVSGEYAPVLYFGTPTAVGRLLSNELVDGINYITVIADATDATYTCLWLNLPGIAKWTGCTFRFREETKAASDIYQFSTFTASDSTISEMEVDGLAGVRGQAYSNAISLVEGNLYRISYLGTRASGTGFPELYLGTASTIGRDLGPFTNSEPTQRIEFTATADDATKTRLWIRLPYTADWTDCALSMKECVEPVTGDELITGWANGAWPFTTFSSTGATITEAYINPGTGTAISNDFTLVEGRMYRLYITGGGASTPQLSVGSALIGYIESGTPNFFMFTATAAMVSDGYLQMTVNNGSANNLVFSLKEITEQAAILGGVHIVSADGGSTRDWTSIDASFDWNDIRSYKIYNHDDVALTSFRWHVQIRDIKNNKWISGWLGLVGENEWPPNYGIVVVSITKANPGRLTCYSNMPAIGEHQLVAFLDLDSMTELNGQYISISNVVNSDYDYADLIDTSGYGSAEGQTGGHVTMVVGPPNTASFIYTTRYGTVKGWENEDEGFEYNIPNNYEVYIVVER